MTLKLKKFNYLPNILTIFRVALIPLFVFFLFQKEFLYQFLSLIVFIIASITDYIDGKIARKYRWETKLGRFLDPLADKLLVLTAFFCFSFKPENNIPFWLVLIILLREIGITLLRIFAITKGSEVKTSFLGKLKTVTQMIAIITTLVLMCIRTFLLEYRIVYVENNKFFWQNIAGKIPGIFLNYLPLILLIIVLFVTFYSGIVYIIVNRKFIK